MDSVAVIKKVKEEFGWMSNMSHHRVMYGELEYHSAEALFQALRFEDLEIQATIREQRNPMSAKITAHANSQRMTTVPRSVQDLDQMRLVLRLKVEQHPELQARLVATGESQIVEDCTNRQHGSGLFWGAARQEDGSWEGENWLGRLWMELRSELIQKQAAPARQT